MKIIDTHCHIYPNDIASKAVENIGKFYNLHMDCDGTVGSLLNEANSFNVDKMVVCSVATSARQVIGINNYMASTLKEDKFLPLATLHPDMNKEEIKEEVKRINELGLKGLKLHPDCQKFKLIDKCAYNIFESLGDFTKPILVHSGDSRFDFSHPKYMAQVARDFPHLKFIAAHLGGWSEWEDASIYEGLNNVMFDTSSSLAFIDSKRAKEVILELGVENVMFATDYPMWDLEKELDRFNAIDLNSEDRELILHKNAERLFHLD